MKHLLSAVTATLLAIASTNTLGDQVSPSTPKEFDLFPGTDTIPIVSWYCITKGNITVENYQELKDCGFNLSLPLNTDFESAKQSLDCAAAVGIRALIPCNELDAPPETIIPKIMNHPGLAGYYLTDEPGASDVPALKTLNQKVKALDSKHFTYLNLLPVVAKLKIPYQQYIDYCSKEVDTPLISYDHYGIVKKKLLPTYFENLEIFSAYARSINKPFWAFAFSTAEGDYAVPNPAQLKFQMYCSLAYGAQGLQYFTYWNLGKIKKKLFREAPVLENGKRSSVYDFVREVNQELQNRNFVFMHSKVQFVRHTGKELPQGTIRLVQADLPKWVQKLDTYGKDAVVSLLRKGKTDYLVIVNGSFDDPMDLTITLAPNVIRIRKDGTSVRADEYEDNLIVLPGECEVFAWQN